MADGTRRETMGDDCGDVQNDRANARDERADNCDGVDDCDGGGRVPASSPITRRWCALDRGWQALALGLVVVGFNALVF